MKFLLLLFSLLPFAAFAQQSADVTFRPLLQQLGEQLLNGRQGSIVAVEPQTGRVLCLVSNSTGESKINRAITGIYAPGSTFKVAQSLALLSEGIIDPNAQFSCQQGFSLGKTHVGCHSHAAGLGVVGALAQSCNTWFCQAMMAMIGDEEAYDSPADAMNQWSDYMQSFGLGHRLGIDMNNEAGGMIPDGQWMSKQYGEQWTSARTLYMGMGQGPLLVTPLQLCNLAAIVANGGYYMTPYVHPSSVAKNPSKYNQRHQTKSSAQALSLVALGMRQTFTVGTCSKLNVSNLAMAGKTGTVQNSGRDHSVFIGYAPVQNPRIAICVYVENAGFGADVAAPMGVKVMRKYLGR